MQYVDPDFAAYVGLATRERLRDLVEHMIESSQYRQLAGAGAPPPVDPITGKPVYSVGVTGDVKRQLLALERVEREREGRYKESIAAERAAIDTDEAGGAAGGSAAETANTGAASNAASSPSSTLGGAPKKKARKKEPSASSRNMSEEIRLRHTNATALMLAGGVTKSWMMSSTAKSERISLTARVGSDGSSKGNTPEETKPASQSGRHSQLLPQHSDVPPPSRLKLGGSVERRVTLRDALFALEQDEFTNRSKFLQKYYAVGLGKKAPSTLVCRPRRRLA